MLSAVQAWPDTNNRHTTNLTAAACAESGLSFPFGNPSSPIDFNKQDFSAFGVSGRNVILYSIENVENVNAIASGSAITFAQVGLTVIYGENGSGKSSYSRLIRNTCTSRTGSVPILSNAFVPGGTTGVTYRAVIDGSDTVQKWVDGKTAVPSFPEIFFFDSACAAAELQGRDNEVLYAPPLVQAFVRMSELLSAVSQRLNDYLDRMVISYRSNLVPLSARNNKTVLSLLDCCDSIEGDRLIKAAALTAEDNKRIVSIPKLIEADPATEIPRLNRKLTQLKQMRSTLLSLYMAFGPQPVKQRKNAANEIEIASEAAKVAQRLIVNSSNLDGVGSETWKALWNAARNYSEGQAYKGVDFPYTGDGARCPLCQQPLSDEAGKRIRSFEQYVTGAAESALKAKKAELEKLETEAKQAMQCMIAEKAGIAIIENAEARSDFDALMELIADGSSIPDEETAKDLEEKALVVDREVRRGLIVRASATLPSVMQSDRETAVPSRRSPFGKAFFCRVAPWEMPRTAHPGSLGARSPRPSASLCQTYRRRLGNRSVRLGPSGESSNNTSAGRAPYGT